MPPWTWYSPQCPAWSLVSCRKWIPTSRKIRCILFSFSSSRHTCRKAGSRTALRRPTNIRFPSRLPPLFAHLESGCCFYTGRSQRIDIPADIRRRSALSTLRGTAARRSPTAREQLLAPEAPGAAARVLARRPGFHRICRRADASHGCSPDCFWCVKHIAPHPIPSRPTPYVSGVLMCCSPDVIHVNVMWSLPGQHDGSSSSRPAAGPPFLSDYMRRSCDSECPCPLSLDQ